MTVKNATKLEVYLEIGKKRVFAGAVDWPGWQRSGRDEDSALQALYSYTQRYNDVLSQAGLEFHSPSGPTDFKVIERLEGDSTTDFGAPGKIPSSDSQPLDESQLDHLKEILQACWAAFDRVVSAAQGVELRQGPRGGGRDREKIIRHVLGADGAYISKLGVKFKLDEDGDPQVELVRIRQAILNALTLSNLAQIPPTGPRGGAHWPPCYFVRRSAWHVLDHAWEIEDRRK
jgi:hypothetical protein